MYLVLQWAVVMRAQLPLMAGLSVGEVTLTGN